MKRIINCDVETFNKHLSYAKKNLVLINRERNKGDANYVANITVNKVICRLTYKKYKYGIVGYDGRVILENKFDDMILPVVPAIKEYVLKLLDGISEEV